MTKAIAVWDARTGVWTMDCPHCGVYNVVTIGKNEPQPDSAGPATMMLGKVECGRCKLDSMMLFWNPNRKSAT